MTINLEKSRVVQAPLADVFALWADVQSHPSLLQNGEGSRLEITEQIPGTRLSWRVSGPEVNSTVTVQFEPAGDDGDATKVTLSAHYPNGIGPNGQVADITAAMEASLASVEGLLKGDPQASVQDRIDDVAASLADGALTAPSYPEVTASAVDLQQSLLAATEAWAASVNKSFQVLSALAWWPLQSLQGAQGKSLWGWPTKAQGAVSP